MRINDSTRVTYGSKISDRIWEDNNGQLICRDAVIARTGSYDYLESEIKDGGSPNKIVKVYRDEKDVFDPISMASFENKPFVNDHPEEDVSIQNHRDLHIGFVRDIRRGTGNLINCLICDIIVTDPEAVRLIKSNEKRELSLGYKTSIEEIDGKYFMRNIRGNHLALVDSGRAGISTIRDSASKIQNMEDKTMRLFGNSKNKQISRLYDEDIIEVEELPEELENTDDEPETVDTIQTQMDECKAKYRDLKSRRDALLNPVQDEEEVEEEEELVETIDEDEELPEVEELEEQDELPEEVEEIEELEEVDEVDGNEEIEELEEVQQDEEIEEEEEYTPEPDDIEDELNDIDEDGELLDADEILKPKKVGDNKKAVAKPKSSLKAYSKLADSTMTNSNDSKIDEKINEAWRNRYSNLNK